MSPTSPNSPAKEEVLSPADLEVTRSEEELLLGSGRSPYQRVRVRKVIVTEIQTISVEVRREELSIEAVDITGCPGVALAEPAPLELVLHHEEIVVQRHVVPHERVRVGIEAVEEPVAVSDVVRQERVGLEALPPERR
jgi:stress response protein YsnF